MVCVQTTSLLGVAVYFIAIVFFFVADKNSTLVRTPRTRDALLLRKPKSEAV